MKEHIEKKCPKCGQRLRFPKNIGGIVMACPSCGKEFTSDFKLGGTRQSTPPQGLFTTLFEMPYKIVCYLGRLLFPK